MLAVHISSNIIEDVSQPSSGHFSQSILETLQEKKHQLGNKYP